MIRETSPATTGYPPARLRGITNDPGDLPWWKRPGNPDSYGIIVNVQAAIDKSRRQTNDEEIDVGPCGSKADSRGSKDSSIDRARQCAPEKRLHGTVALAMKQCSVSQSGGRSQQRDVSQYRGLSEQRDASHLRGADTGASQRATRDVYHRTFQAALREISQGRDAFQTAHRDASQSRHAHQVSKRGVSQHNGLSQTAQRDASQLRDMPQSVKRDAAQYCASKCRDRLFQKEATIAARDAAQASRRDASQRKGVSQIAKRGISECDGLSQTGSNGGSEHAAKRLRDNHRHAEEPPYTISVSSGRDGLRGCLSLAGPDGQQLSSGSSARSQPPLRGSLSVPCPQGLDRHSLSKPARPREHLRGSLAGSEDQWSTSSADQGRRLRGSLRSPEQSLTSSARTDKCLRGSFMRLEERSLTTSAYPGDDLWGGIAGPEEQPFQEQSLASPAGIGKRRRRTSPAHSEERPLTSSAHPGECHRRSIASTEEHCLGRSAALGKRLRSSVACSQERSPASSAYPGDFRQRSTVGQEEKLSASSKCPGRGLRERVSHNMAHTDADIIIGTVRQREQPQVRTRPASARAALLTQLGIDTSRSYDELQWRKEQQCRFTDSLGQSRQYHFHLPLCFERLRTCVDDSGRTTTRIWPLLVYMHGNDGKSFFQHSKDTLWLDGAQFAAKTFAVVSPSCEWKWSQTPSEWIIELVQAFSMLDWIDRQRIYLTGNSMGGMGTWEIAAMAPNMFAAIAPVAAYHDREKEDYIACQLRDMPVFAIHCKVDSLCPKAKEEPLWRKLKPGGALHNTIFEGVDHVTIAKQAYYLTPDLYKWLLKRAVE